MTGRLQGVFEHLIVAFGTRGWWPGDSALEIIVGAILTQNTAWKNVEKAIGNLKREGLMDVAKLYRISVADLAAVIRPSGFFNIKALRLKAFMAVLQQEFGGSIAMMASQETAPLRERLLAIKGIGPETADSILLYALDKPVFVVDAYTKRFVKNHRMYDGDDDYEAIRHFFMKHLSPDLYLYNEFHALIVCLGQRFCRKAPVCRGCPLEKEDEEWEKGRNGQSAGALKQP